MQDKEDDLKVGVKSTALRFGDSTKEWVTGFGIACISSLALCGYNANIGWPFYAFLAAASSQLAWQISKVDLSCRADCNSKFVSNKCYCETQKQISLNNGEREMLNDIGGLIWEREMLNDIRGLIWFQMTSEAQDHCRSI
ncbi:Palmitoyl-protein thioesterase 1 [Sarracenia purpurea var. burkii]